MHDCYTHQKDQAQYALSDWCVFKRHKHLNVSHLSICCSCCHKIQGQQMWDNFADLKFFCFFSPNIWQSHLCVSSDMELWFYVQQLVVYFRTKNQSFDCTQDGKIKDRMMKHVGKWLVCFVIQLSVCTQEGEIVDQVMKPVGMWVESCRYLTVCLTRTWSLQAYDL